MTRAAHRLLRRLLPAELRRRHGAEMEEVFVEACASAARRGRGAVARLWLRELADMAATGRRLRAEGRRFGAGFVARGRDPRRKGDFGGGVMGLADDFRYALRSLVRRPSLAAFAAVTLALGIGSTTAIFSTLESVVLHPLPFEDGDRLVGLFRQIGTARAYLTPGPEELETWAAQTDLFEAIEPWSFRSMTLTGRGEAREVQAALVRPSFLELLGRRPLLGRTFDDGELAGDGARVVMVGHAFWQRELAGSPEALGTTLALDGEPWTIVGVMPRRTPVPGWGLRSVDLWRPLGATSAHASTPATALLREGVTVDRVNERFAQLGDGDGSRPAGKGHASLVAEQVGANVRGTLGLLMGAVVLLLLISCVNVSNLLLFRANARRHETAVRSALGGGRGRLTRQLLIESLLLATAGGGLGVGLSLVGQIAIRALRPSQLDVLDVVSINARVLWFALAITLVTGVLFGLVPALHAGRAEALEPLRSGTRSEGDVVGRRARWLLVSGEVALSFALLLGSLSVLSTLLDRQRTDVGFRADEVVVVQMEVPAWKHDSDEARRTLFDALDDRLARQPGVARVARASGSPSRAGIWFGKPGIEGEPPGEETVVLHGPAVDARYFDALGQPLLGGRPFTEEEVRTEAPVVILGGGTARAFYGERDAVGSRFRIGDDEWMTVVGVAGDVPMTGLDSNSGEYQFYVPLQTSWTSTYLVRVAPGIDARRLLPLVRAAAVDVEPDLRIDELTVASSMLRDTLERERFATTVMATFAALALVLAAVGLYGVVSQVVGQRTREIGIRIALGARRARIASMVLRRAGGATLAGIAIGIALAIGGTRLLEARVVGLSSTGAGTFSLAALALVLTSFLAAYAPARRAARVDPVDAMRGE